jgi:hypothetical protein
VHLGSKVQVLEDANEKLRLQASRKHQSPSKALTYTNAELRLKLTTAVTMLRQCQHVFRSYGAKATDLEQASKFPDIEAFAQSCVPLGVADQRAFSNANSYQAPDPQAALKASWLNVPGSQLNIPRPEAAASFSFPQPPNEQVIFRRLLPPDSMPQWVALFQPATLYGIHVCLSVQHRFG